MINKGDPAANQPATLDRRTRALRFGLCLQPYACALSTPVVLRVNKNLLLPLRAKNASTSSIIEALEEIIITDRQKSHGDGVEKTLDKATLDRYRLQVLAMHWPNRCQKSKRAMPLLNQWCMGFGHAFGIGRGNSPARPRVGRRDHAPSVDNGVDEVQLIKGANALRHGGDVVGGAIQLSTEVSSRK